MTDAHDPLVVRAGSGQAPPSAAHTSQEDRHFRYKVCKFNNMYGLVTREPVVVKRNLSLKELFDAVQECQVCSCFSA